ncbi:MAG: biopolymer transporter ExbD [Candidatus Kapabacteria bacterium]|nr:biopolymer transporter ExbD [Ignavibacteriota bacterium]MCW5884468.1 biopolymer transporter ExbD [Candidatus Kapabacteria bacterium]
MAGGGQLKVERSKRGKASKRKKLKRVGFHLDMTPLVDITFLLLTFFMFTTTMATPQTMEMSVPPEKTEIEVGESMLLTIFVRDDNKLFYAHGQEDPTEIELKQLKGLAERENLKPDVMNKLITALKPSENASYGTVVSILDELNLAEIAITAEVAKKIDENGNPTERERRFTIAPMNEDEIAKIAEL